MRELKTTQLDQDGIYQNENQWVLDTEGVNLLDVSFLLSLTQCARTLFNPYFVVYCICLSHTLHQNPGCQFDCSFCAASSCLCAHFQFLQQELMCFVLDVQHDAAGDVHAWD